MDTYLRLILLFTGVFILAGVMWDIWRRKHLGHTQLQLKHGKRQAEKSRHETSSKTQRPHAALQQQMQGKRKIFSLRGQQQPLTDNIPGGSAAYASMSMTERQLETIMPSDPRIEKVDAKRIGATIAEKELLEEFAFDAASDAAEANNAAFVQDDTDVVAQAIDTTTAEFYAGKKSEAFQQANEAEFVIALTVVARMQRGFSGHRLLKSLESAGLVFGEMNIFHYFAAEGGAEPLFSISSAMEPGTFNLAELPTSFVPGVTLFMRISDQIDICNAFELMVRTAKQLGFSLNGELRDQSHRPLTVQTIERYRNKVMAYAKEYA